MFAAAVSPLKRCLGNTAVCSNLAALTRMKHDLPPLKYDFNALEPYISADIMKLHYEKHHRAYVTNLNIAEEKLAEASAKHDTAAIISLLPALKFNGGGHINHSIFWDNLSPKGGGEPKGDLMNTIKENFGTFDKMKGELVTAATGVQGSGWAWLGWNKVTGRLRISVCANQDPLQATTGLVPLFGIDVWEHAYYLQYKNVRPDYVQAIFNVANWDDVARRLAEVRNQ